MTIESENAKETIKENIEKCIRCGLCKPNCSVFRIVREEQYSPRGMIALLENDHYERILYDCNLCKSCEIQCPLNIKVCESMVKARMILVDTKKEIESNKVMIKNLEKTGNIFGIFDSVDDD